MQTNCFYGPLFFLYCTVLVLPSTSNVEYVAECWPIKSKHLRVFSSEQIPSFFGQLIFTSRPHPDASDRQLQVSTKVKGHCEASERLKTSNCPCDQSANMSATSLRRPEEDPGLCSLRECVGGKTEGEIQRKEFEYLQKEQFTLKSNKIYFLLSLAPS